MRKNFIFVVAVAYLEDYGADVVVFDEFGMIDGLRKHRVIVVDVCHVDRQRFGRSARPPVSCRVMTCDLKLVLSFRLTIKYSCRHELVLDSAAAAVYAILQS